MTGDNKVGFRVVVCVEHSLGIADDAPSEAVEVGFGCGEGMWIGTSVESSNEETVWSDSWESGYKQACNFSFLSVVVNSLECWTRDNQLGGGGA